MTMVKSGVISLTTSNMLNSTEEQSYWYLRLNGFFLIDNFVIHKSDNIDYTSDADLMAIRTPFVYEEIGGQEKDWDNHLFDNFDNDATIGIICQVKGGRIGNEENLFREPYLTYSMHRFGFTNNTEEITKQLEEAPVATIINELGQKYQIAKFLISRDTPRNHGNYLFMTVAEIYGFIFSRLERYPIEKYRDRYFFSSLALQTLIETEKMRRNKR